MDWDHVVKQAVRCKIGTFVSVRIGQREVKVKIRRKMCRPFINNTSVWQCRGRII